jgi:hypothetical protein
VPMQGGTLVQMPNGICPTMVSLGHAIRRRYAKNPPRHENPTVLTSNSMFGRLVLQLLYKQR